MQQENGGGLQYAPRVILRNAVTKNLQESFQTTDVSEQILRFAQDDTAFCLVYAFGALSFQAQSRPVSVKSRGYTPMTTKITAV